MTTITALERASRAGRKCAIAPALATMMMVMIAGCVCRPAHGVRIWPAVRVSGDERAKAVFAMGSFWRAEAVFGCQPGVTRTRVGYCGGTKVSPDYHGVGDHAECVEVEFDPAAVRYEQLLDLFWSNHDPCQVFGQGPDVGDQYRSVIVASDEQQSVLADLSKRREQMKLGERAVVTTNVLLLSPFYPAEREHQKFELRRNSALLQLLGDIPDDELVTSTIGTKLNSFAAGFCPKPIQKLIHANVTPLLESRPMLLRLFGDSKPEGRV